MRAVIMLLMLLITFPLYADDSSGMNSTDNNTNANPGNVTVTPPADPAAPVGTTDPNANTNGGVTQEGTGTTTGTTNRNTTGTGN